MLGIRINNVVKVKILQAFYLNGDPIKPTRFWKFLAGV